MADHNDRPFEQWPKALQLAYVACDGETAEMLRHQHAEIQRLTAERDAARKDAERYRWLRSFPNNITASIYGPTSTDSDGLLRRDEYLDAAIDAAMERLNG